MEKKKLDICVEFPDHPMCQYTHKIKDGVMEHIIKCPTPEEGAEVSKKLRALEQTVVIELVPEKKDAKSK
jgi:hypothetical protein